MKRISVIICMMIVLMFFPSFLFAWDGYDHNTGSYIEIENIDSLVPGSDVEIYDYSDESYHAVYIISVDRNGALILEVFDYTTGDYRTFEMMTGEMPQKRT